MLIGAIVVGGLMGLVIEAGMRGLIPAWGGANTPAWLRLMLIVQGGAGICILTDVDTGKGVVIVSLSWLGAMSLGRAIMGAAIEIVRAARSF